MSTIARTFKPYQPSAASQSQGLTSYSTTANLHTFQQRAQQLAAQNAGQSQGAGYGTKSQNTIRDDYERWYTESTASNRMLLSLRSGIETEIAWALERLCRLSCNDQFTLSSIPGLIDVLYEWPEWFLDTYGTRQGPSSSRQESSSSPESLKASRAQLQLLFAPSLDETRRRRFALEALFILRNAALGSHNASELSAHPKTRTLITRTLAELSLGSDEATQFTVYTLDLLHCLAGSYVLPSPKALANSPIPSPVKALEKLVSESKNRALIIGAFSSLTTLLSIPQNASHNTESSPAVTACIRYLPLYQDPGLVDACLNYLYAHLSYPPMTKTFLLNPQLPNTLKLLVGYIIAQQGKEKATRDVSVPSRSVPSVKVNTVVDELTSEEIKTIGVLPEPQRCHEWLRSAIKASPDEEMTQVEFWTSYRDYFTPYADKHTLLAASDCIKAVNQVYPSAQAMVVDDGDNKRFIIRGITKRKKFVFAERLMCKWNRSQCEAKAFPATEGLHEHIKAEHLSSQDSVADGGNPDFTCKWATCQHSAPTLQSLMTHVWTHLPLKLQGSAALGIVPHMTIPSTDDGQQTYLIADATSRKPPPEPRTVVEYPSPSRDPLSGSLAALLILRTLFRASFASVEAAPRADNDHFGFPGVIEDEEADEAAAAMSGDQTESEREGERRGRRAFLGVRSLMEGIHIKDPALMSWIHEMMDTGSSS